MWWDCTSGFSVLQSPRAAPAMVQTGRPTPFTLRGPPASWLESRPSSSRSPSTRSTLTALRDLGRRLVRALRGVPSARSILPHHPLFHAWSRPSPGPSEGRDPGARPPRVPHRRRDRRRARRSCSSRGSPGPDGSGSGPPSPSCSSAPGFIAEAATGENLLPGSRRPSAARLATRHGPDLRKLGLATGPCVGAPAGQPPALPGALIAAAPALPKGRRLERSPACLAFAGVVVLALVRPRLGLGADARPGKAFGEYLTRFGHQARWTGACLGSTRNLSFTSAPSGPPSSGGPGWRRSPTSCRRWPGWRSSVSPQLGASRNRSFAEVRNRGVPDQLAIRIPLYAWFEPQNFEWQILPIVLLVALGSRTARGPPASAPKTRAIGLGPRRARDRRYSPRTPQNTWILRDRLLASAVDEAIAAGGPNAYYFAVEKNAMMAPSLRCSHTTGWTQLGRPRRPRARARIQETRELGRPIVVIADRFIGTGMQFDLEHAAEGLRAFDSRRSAARSPRSTPTSRTGPITSTARRTTPG